MQVAHRLSDPFLRDVELGIARGTQKHQVPGGDRQIRTVDTIVQVAPASSFVNPSFRSQLQPVSKVEGLLDRALDAFVPVGGTPLASHPPPSADFLRAVLGPVGRWLTETGMTSDTAKAGCVKCAACSTLSTFEKQSDRAA